MNPRGKEVADAVGSEAEWKRHPDLYLNDGSVVLLAEDTLFRVYMGWLGRHSEASWLTARLSQSDCPYPGIFPDVIVQQRPTLRQRNVRRLSTGSSHRHR